MEEGILLSVRGRYLTRTSKDPHSRVVEYIQKQVIMWGFQEQGKRCEEEGEEEEGDIASVE